MQLMRPRSHPSVHMRWSHVPVMAALIAVLFSTVGAFVPMAAAEAAAVAKGPQSHPYKGTPNRFHVPAKPDRSGPYPGPAPAHMPKLPAGVDTTIHHPFTPTMHELVIPLTHSVRLAPNLPPTVQAVASDTTGSDGTLEVQVPAGALTSSDITAAGGSATLVVDQVGGISGSTDGGTGSGRIFLGTYTFQVQDAHGHEISTKIALRQPITLLYHWHGKHAPVDLQHQAVLFTLNPALPIALPHPLVHPGKVKEIATTYDAKSNTLKTIVPLSQSGGGSFTTSSPVGYFGKPDAFQNDLHTGSLNDTITIDTPGGPGGLSPSLNLSYSSESIAETHGAQAASTWVGEGWSLDPGEITWSEQNIPAPDGTANWVDGWSISDPYGTSGPLLPPNTTTATYYDDTPNPPSGVTYWRTATESHAKIVSYENPTVDCTNFPEPSKCGSGGYSVQPPCFRVWLPNGIMEEFGCMPDSRQWYPGGASQTTNYVNAWKLDLITNPSSEQIQFTYAQDMTHNKYGDNYPRDVVLSSVQWDASNCSDAQARCTGTSWNPKMQVIFDYGHAVTHWAPGAHQCSQSGYLRCDDPQGSSTESTPAITPTEVLNEITVQVAGSGSFQTLRQYTLAYSQGAGSVIIDPWTGASEDIAGYLLLEQVTEYGSDLHTQYPTMTFAYAIPTAEYYEDGQYTPNSNAGCGPAWNTGKRANGQGVCVLWYRTYSDFFMTEADNGMGMQSTFSWTNMRTNQHGVYASAPPPDNDPAHPYACSDLQGNQSPGWNIYPCDLADDNGWSHITLTQRTEQANDPLSNNSGNQVTATWSYNYNLASLSAQECSDCLYGMYWGNANDGDVSDFYNGKFTGFDFAQVINPDGSLEDDYFYSTEGWGVWDNTKVACHTGQSTCPNAPAWDLVNAATGRAYQVDDYGIKSGGSYPLLKRTQTTYAAICPTYHVSATPPPTSGIYTGFTWNGHLVSEVDQDNPAALCDIETTGTTTYDAEGQSSPSSSNSPMLQTTTAYDGTNSYGHVSSVTTTGNDLGVTPTIKKTSTYIWHDAIATTSTSATGTYITDRVAFSDVEDGSSNQKACTYTQYDGQSYGTGSQSGLTKGLATQVNKYATCSSGGGTGEVTTKTGYDSAGDVYWTLDADANAGVSGHTGCTINGTNYTTCNQYANPYGFEPYAATNDKGQTTYTHYTTTDANAGYGLWPTSTTDANGQTTSTAYDYLGRVISTTLPGETTGDTTTATSYSFSTCPATGPGAPCIEVDSTQRLDSSTTVTTRDFYDGWGHHMESGKPGPNGQDVVQFVQYDSLGHEIFQSQPYFVTSGTGYSIPDMSQIGTSYTYDGLGRTLTVKQPDSSTTTTSYSAACNAPGLNDTSCYSETTTMDANSHQQTSFADAQGQDFYDQDWTGTGPYTSYRVVRKQYDSLGNVVNTRYADGSHAATATYDDLSRLTAISDPDLGSWTYSYDANGNKTQSVDPRGSSGTVYTGYDGLNRVLWQSVNSNGSNPFASNTYDSTANGNEGIGHLTSETFASGPSQSSIGSYAYT